jgi:hypothetical protein
VRPPCTPFRRGFINGDSRVDISDAIGVLKWLFQGGEPPGCEQSADVNNDNQTDVSDAVFLLSWLFAGGFEPPAPFQSCSPDPDGGTLPCARSAVCE